MLVSQLINSNGRPTANQFVLSLDNGDVAFQSYNSRVCEIRRKGGMGFKTVIVLGRDWDYSRTTQKHLHTFLKDNGYDFGSSENIRRAIRRGYVQNNEDVAIWYDETMR